MTKSDQERYDALLQRVTDIYSGAVGGMWNNEDYLVSAEELSVIVPAIGAVLIPEEYDWRKKVWGWLPDFATPEGCTNCLWLMFYKREAGDE